MGPHLKTNSAILCVCKPGRCTWMPLCRPFMLGWWEPIMKTLVLLSQAKNSRTHSVEFSWGSSAKLSSRCLQPQPTQLLTCLLSSPSLIHSSKFPLCFLGVTFLKKPHKHVLRSGSVLGESLRPRKTFKWWWTCAPESVYYYLHRKDLLGYLSPFKGLVIAGDFCARF